MDIKYILQSHGIRPSLHRMAVYKYLLEEKNHPSADLVYRELHKSIPTLSKTTVYNTLKLFVENGVALRLDVDDKEAHYDGDTTTQAHFYCLGCGKILDIYSNVVTTDNIPELQGLDILETRVYFKGYCNQCKIEN